MAWSQTSYPVKIKLHDFFLQCTHLDIYSFLLRCTIYLQEKVGSVYYYKASSKAAFSFSPTDLSVADYLCKKNCDFCFAICELILRGS
jgi:hypothetical protein